ncbi:putative lysine-specific demethylase JMJD5 [Iris pallida]|uniref:Lysine-specific demethylase JMJD5 n=1 Tax=Iris pallida TaxID=29817 RepID=A0AAX6G8P4_IRIPA|nr:putative lysine-specific demethylase JMJD5 [Iris pallida]
MSPPPSQPRLRSWPSSESPEKISGLLFLLLFFLLERKLEFGNLEERVCRLTGAASPTGVGSDGDHRQYHRLELASMFPFSSFASTMQRRIKVYYDELVQSNQASKLTMAQVCFRRGVVCWLESLILMIIFTQLYF